jgi:hypothetical protein
VSRGCDMGATAEMPFSRIDRLVTCGFTASFRLAGAGAPVFGFAGAGAADFWPRSTRHGAQRPRSPPTSSAGCKSTPSTVTSPEPNRNGCATGSCPPRPVSPAANAAAGYPSRPPGPGPTTVRRVHPDHGDPRTRLTFGQPPPHDRRTQDTTPRRRDMRPTTMPSHRKDRPLRAQTGRAATTTTATRQSSRLDAAGVDPNTLIVTRRPGGAVILVDRGEPRSLLVAASPHVEEAADLGATGDVRASCDCPIVIRFPRLDLHFSSRIAVRLGGVRRRTLQDGAAGDEHEGGGSEPVIPIRPFRYKFMLISPILMLPQHLRIGRRSATRIVQIRSIVY